MTDVKAGSPKSLAGSSKLGHGRADYTTDVISNVDVTVQSERLSTVIFANVNSVTDAEPTLPTPTVVYASDWQEAGNYTMIRGHIHSDSSGTIYLEQSSDSSATKTAYIETTQAYIANSEAGGFTEDIAAKYVRLRFVPTGNTTLFVAWARLSAG